MSFITAYDFYTQVCGLSDEELIQKMVKATEHRSFRKGEYIAHEGEVINDVYFLEKGVFRGSFVDTNGKDITDCIGFQCGIPAIAFCCMDMDIVSPESIEVLADSSFFFIPISVIIELLKNYLDLTVFYNRMLIMSLNMHRTMKKVLYQYSAPQRYQWFLKEYPGLIDQISNKYIASFLGMSPVTLSRLRRALREEKS